MAKRTTFKRGDGKYIIEFKTMPMFVKKDKGRSGWVVGKELIPDSGFYSIQDGMYDDRVDAINAMNIMSGHKR